MPEGMQRSCLRCFDWRIPTVQTSYIIFYILLPPHQVKDMRNYLSLDRDREALTFVFWGARPRLLSVQKRKGSSRERVIRITAVAILYHILLVAREATGLKYDITASKIKLIKNVIILRHIIITWWIAWVTYQAHTCNQHLSANRIVIANNRIDPKP